MPVTLVGVFIKISRDVRADLIYVDATGRAFAWINGGLGTWQKVGRIATIRADEDLSDSSILFADVNGDGLADYLVVYGGGAVKAWLNNGNIGRQDGQRLWTGPHIIAPGVAENDDGSKVRFADLNGDGSRFLQMDGDKETVATGAGEPGSKVRFVQFDDDGKAEYVVQYGGGAAKAFLNTGDIPGGRDTVNWIDIGVVAAGVGEQGPVFYADIDGDGKDDYLVRYADGTINVWADAAMTDSMRYWRDNPPGKDTHGEFSTTLAGYFKKGSGLSLNMKCNSMTSENGCHANATPNCSDSKDDGGGVSPGGWLILSSMISINSNYWNIFDAIDAEANDVFDNVPKLASTFDSPPPTDKTAEMLLNLLHQAWAVFAAPNLAKIFKNTPLQDNTLVGPIVGDRYTLTMNELNEGTQYIDGTQDLQAQVKVIAKLWLIGMEGVGNATFDGSEDYMTNLVTLIAEGAYLDPDVPSALEMRQQIEKPLYAMIIPATWNRNSNPKHAEKAVFILSTDYDCSNSDECPDRPPGYPNGLEMFMTSDAAQKTCFCHEGKSINTWAANGKKDGYKLDFDDPEAIGLFTGDNSIESPGAISIPVCGISEVYDNWENSEDSKHFPCS
ncbi:hypothetical protein VE03_01482 [Pseudogymnoascus sp. 23342-1-I1]|nr:hypothetical protein VE03_01482 [Pseudogymnoascus sp. 23342-1-I1]